MVNVQAKLWLTFGVMGALAIGAVAAAQGGASGVAWALMLVQLIAGGVVLWAGRRKLQALDRMSKAQKDVLEAARKGDLEQLERSQKAAQAVIDSLPHAVALVSPEGRIEMANEGGRIFGFELGKHVDAVPHTWLKKLVSDAVATRARALQQTEVKGNGREKEALVQMFNEGRELFYLPQSTPLLDAKGNVFGVMVVLVDVTSARQVDEAKSSLLSSFSHELKTPMTSLQMSIYLLLDDAASRLTPRQMELLTAARDDADRLHRLVEEVLSAARKVL